MLKVCMNMRDLCLMNADKTDISNTNRSRNQSPALHFQREIQEIQLESQSARDLNAKKQRSAGEQKIRDIKEITKSLSDGSSINPTGIQKVTTGINSHKDKSVGESGEVPKHAGEQELTAQARTATKATPQ